MRVNKLLLIVFLTFILVGCGASETTVDSTGAKSADIDTMEYAGVLGRDFSSDELTGMEGMSFDATMIFWSETSHNAYPYIFNFYEKDEEGSAVISFGIEDKTEEKTLSALEEYSYRDDLAVKMQVVLDGIEYYKKDDGTLLIEYHASACKAEFLEPGSVENKLANNGYFVTGNTINFESGLSIHIVDTGTCFVYGEYCAYVEIEAINNGSEDVQLLSAEFYGDDYELNEWYDYDGVDISYSKISPGRKFHGGYYANLNYNEYDLIEAEIGDAIVLVKYEIENFDSFSNVPAEDIDYEYLYGEIMAAILMDADEGQVYNGHAFYDIDKDGYCELLFNIGSCDADMMYHVCTTKGEGVTYVGQIGGDTGLYECPDGNGIYTDYCQMGYEVVNIAYMEDGNIYEETVLDGETDDYGYMNGQPIEQLQYPIQISHSFGNEYLLPESDVRYLTEEEVRSLDPFWLPYARNEIFARHGYIFNNPDYQYYFESQSWYYGYVSADDFQAEAVFNEYEISNLDLIKRIENE